MNITISQLFVFPVKSLRGIPVKEAKLTPTGLLWDRHWMIVKPNGGFITQRQFPNMVLIHTQLTDEHLILSKEGMPPLTIPLIKNTFSNSFKATVWKDECDVVDEGEAASQWLTEAIGAPDALRLVRLLDGSKRPQSKPDLLGEATTTHFADAAPYLVCNQTSLDAVNESLQKNKFDPVPIDNFRPNILLNGIEAFDEHIISELHHPDYQLRHCYPCHRCAVPTININTGKRHPKQQPFSLISELNSMPDQPKAPAFGENAILTKGADQIIKVGDSLTAIKK